MGRGDSGSPQSRTRSRCKTSSSTLVASRASGGGEPWENVSLGNVEHQKQVFQERNAQNPIYNRLGRNVSNLGRILDWTVDHIELPFTWPTRYTEEGEERTVTEEEDLLQVSRSSAREVERELTDHRLLFS